MKNFRTIATSLLLFQHVFFPVTVFTEETPVEIDTELVQRLQEQKELAAIESAPPTTESTVEESIHTDSTEVPPTEDSNPEQSETVETPEQSETVETTETPISESSEETVEQTIPSAEGGKESSEENELSSPAEEETEQLMVLPEAMRVSTYSSLPNLDAYRHYLVNNGTSAYIENKMQATTNRELTLGAEVGATQNFTVSYDTHAMVQEAGNGWISWIASDKYGIPEYYYQQMYYGNHPTFSNEYTLGNLKWSGVPSYLEVTASTPSISNNKVTFNVTIRRTGNATNDQDTLHLLGNLTMGTTAVAPAVGNYSKKIENVNYSDAVIGAIIVNNPKPSVVIKDSVVVEATRNALSQDTIKSWFSTLPSNSNDYTFSATGPASWAPGATGTATVDMKHNSTGTTQSFTTQYTVVDTQAPTANIKTQGVEIEARRMGDWTREELLKFIDGDLKDNWSLSENIRIEATSNTGIYPIAGAAPGDTWAYLDIYDEAGNKYQEAVSFKIVDTQAPTANIKTQGVEIEARRTGDWTREELLKFIDGDLKDNWSLPENIRIEATSNTGIYPIAGAAPGDTWAYLDIYDEAGNKYQKAVSFKIVDTQAPTGTVKNGTIDVEARRSGNLSQAELRGFMATMSDNWTLAENITIHYANAAGGEGGTIAGYKPGTIVPDFDSRVLLRDEAGNKSSLMPVTLRIVDTQAPIAKVKTQGVEIEARRTGDWTREELLKFIDGDLKDNWSLPENIRIEATSNTGIYPIAGAAPGDTWAYLDIYDEAGNKYQEAVSFKIVDSQAPTGTVKNGTIDVEARRSGDLSQTELRGFMETMSDNWTLAENITVHLVNGTGGAVSIAGYKPGTIVPASNSYIQLEDEAGNKSMLMPITLRIVDTQAPEGTLKYALTMEADRSRDFTQEELRQIFEQLSDNWSHLEDITLKSSSSLSSLKPNIDGYYYVLAITATDEEENSQRFERALVRIEDTLAPTGTVKNETIDVEARRTGELSQDELRQFFTTVSDNWTLPEDIKFHLVNADGSAASIAGVNPEAVLDAHIQLEDEAGNKSSPMQISARIVDTTGPQGTVKENLFFYEGGSEPNVRDYLEGEPSDNWTLPEAIKATIVYENNADFTDLKVGTHKFVLTLTDEAGNATDLSGQLEIKEDLRGDIDVTIPVRISFAESKESGGIVSPTYQIQNNSNEELDVSVASMTSHSETEKLTEIDLLMSNNYNDTTIPLIQAGNNLAQKTKLVTLPKKTNSFVFSLHGTVGPNFDFESLTDPLKPQYAVEFNFAIN